MKMQNSLETREVYSIRCPVHRNIEIGEWCSDPVNKMHLGFYCGKCRRIIRFNKDNFINSLTVGLFPVKIL